MSLPAMSVKTRFRSRYLVASALLTLAPLAGCSPDMTPEEPDIDALEQWVSDNPDLADSDAQGDEDADAEEDIGE